MRKKWLTGFLVAAIAAIVGVGAVLAASPASAPPAPNPQEGDGDAATSTRPFLGLRLAPVAPLIADVLGLPDTHGAVVVGVLEDGPAAAAGIGRGDVIRAVRGTPVLGPDDVTSTIQALSPGDSVEITLLQGGNEVTVTVVLGEHPVKPRPRPAPLLVRDLGRRLAGLIPRLVQGDLQVLGKDGQVIHVTITPGKVSDVQGNVVSLVRRDDQPADFTIAGETPVIKRGHRVGLDALEEGDPVVVIQREGEVVAIIVGAPRPRQPRYGPQPGHPPAFRNAPGEVAERLLRHFKEQMERQQHMLREHFGRMQERMDSLEARIAALEEAAP